MRILLPLLMISAAACTASARDVDRQARADAADQAALARSLTGLNPGRPQDCVEQTRLRESQTFGDTIVYRGAGSTRYINRTSGGCNIGRDDAILVTRTPSTLLCRGDIAQAIDRTSHFPVGSCSYGAFIPYSKPR